MMKPRNILPVCRYPTTIVLIDDDKDFLNSIVSYFKDCYLIKEFYNPCLALEYMEEVNSTNMLEEKYVSVLESSSLEEVTLSIGYYTLSKEIYNTEKNKSISTLIIDYDMPGTNGLEICKNISLPNITKILLSGNIEDQTIIEAFNNGIIDGYIDKKCEDLLSQLENILVQSEEHYFNKLSSFCSYAMLLDKDRASYLNSPQYICFFNKLLKDEQIIEYYLFDSIGNYLMKSKDGSLKKLYISDEEGFKSMLEILPDEVPKEITEDIKTKRKMLCYSDEGQLPNSCEKYIYPSLRIPGITELYYSLVPIEDCVLL